VCVCVCHMCCCGPQDAPVCATGVSGVKLVSGHLNIASALALVPLKEAATQEGFGGAYGPVFIQKEVDVIALVIIVIIIIIISFYY
jgi:hypothetical protein